MDYKNYLLALCKGKTVEFNGSYYKLDGRTHGVLNIETKEIISPIEFKNLICSKLM